MRKTSALLAAVALAMALSAAWAKPTAVNKRLHGSVTPVGGTKAQPLGSGGRLLAFMSTRPATKGSISLYLYNIDHGTTTSVKTTGVLQGGPGLCTGSRYVAYASAPSQGAACAINVYDRVAKSNLDLTGINPGTVPSISSDGNAIAYQSGTGNSCFIYIYYRSSGHTTPLVKSVLGNDCACPSISSDANYIAFEAIRTIANGGQGGWDICLWDVKANKRLSLTACNSGYNDAEPSISGDGHYIAFVSQRPPGSSKSEHIYLYDRVAQTMVDLPGLNSASDNDKAPSISDDGRYIAFMSDRQVVAGAAKAWHIFLYDRDAKALVDLPGLMTSDPAVLDCSPCIK